MFDQIRDIIAEELDVDKDKVTMEASVIDDLGADSLDVVELIMALEESFDIEVDDNKAQSMKTVKDIVDYIENQS